MEQNPFTFGSMITDPNRFIGRRTELTTIIDRLNGVQAQGSAVVGPRRIGKSSLLHYLYRPRANEVLRPSSNNPVIYLSAADGECETPEQFRTTLMLKVIDAYSLDGRTTEGRELKELQRQITAAKECSWSTAKDVLEQLAQKPVICLDEFEALLSPPFDDRFFNSLRSWANEGLLNWITASAKPLQELRNQNNLTSPFFNLLATVQLGELKDQEAQTLLALADNTLYKFDHEEKRELIKTAATNSPYHLQIVASKLWRMKAGGEETNYSLIREELCRQYSPPPHCQKDNQLQVAKILLAISSLVFISIAGIRAWQVRDLWLNDVNNLGDLLNNVFKFVGSLGDFAGGIICILGFLVAVWSVVVLGKPVKKALAEWLEKIGG